LNGWLKEDTDYKGYYSEQVNLKEGTISDSLLREFILVHTALDPTELETHYTVGINGKALSPLWDQEMLIKYTIANVINKEHFIEDGKNQPHLTHIEGSAGAGKSTIATVVNDALKHANLGLRVVVSATSETKTKEFAEAMGEKDSSIVDKLIPNSIWSTTGTSSIIKIIDDLISTVKFTDDNSSPTLTGNIKVFNDLEVEFNIVFKDQVVQEVKFTDSAIEQILKYLDEHEYAHLKDTLYFIDESTYIDPLYVQLLNALHKRNIRVVTLGDPLQLGFTINLGKGLKGPFNLTHVYPNLLKGHRLNGIFRAQNTGVKENLAALGNLSKSVEKYSHPEFEYNEDVVKGVISRFKE
jgi:adenylate kinase family enzyme